MAQFDVFKNRNTSTRKIYPLLLDVQHPVLDSLSTRIVIPLARTRTHPSLSMEVLAPVVQFDEEIFVLMTPQISAIPARSLQEPVGSLAECRTEIIAALDFAFTGY